MRTACTLVESHSYIMHYAIYLFSVLALITPFHSLGGNKIQASGATALADALRVNQSLKALK